jgi:hypothetical protein
MHPLIEQAKQRIRSWTSDSPRDLLIDVASLCREILDTSELPEKHPDWGRLRLLFDIKEGPLIAETITAWDDQCRLGDFDVLNSELLYIKLAIVTWTVKKLLKKFGMLFGPIDPPVELDAWKEELIGCLDRYIVVSKRGGTT